MKKKIILIDDYKLYGAVFGYIIKDMYDQWAEFELLEEITNTKIKRCYEDNPDALFIQDNDLTSKADRNAGRHIVPGIEWIKMYGRERAIIFHTGDRAPDLGFKAAQYGAKLYMKKDDPESPMTNQQMQDQIIGFHKVIINHLGLVPEYIWLAYMKMGIIQITQIEEPPDTMDPDHVAQMKEDQREL